MRRRQWITISRPNSDYFLLFDVEWQSMFVLNIQNDEKKNGLKILDWQNSNAKSMSPKYIHVNENISDTSDEYAWIFFLSVTVCPANLAW